MIIAFSDLLDGIRKRKADLGIVNTPESTEAMRNRGITRTPAKREMLKRIDERAAAAGKNAPKAYY